MSAPLAAIRAGGAVPPPRARTTALGAPDRARPGSVSRRSKSRPLAPVEARCSAIRLIAAGPSPNLVEGKGNRAAATAPQHIVWRAFRPSRRLPVAFRGGTLTRIYTKARILAKRCRYRGGRASLLGKRTHRARERRQRAPRTRSGTASTLTMAESLETPPKAATAETRRPCGRSGRAAPASAAFLGEGCEAYARSPAGSSVVGVAGSAGVPGCGSGLAGRKIAAARPIRARAARLTIART
jgi:hypothetical protein